MKTNILKSIFTVFLIGIFCFSNPLPAKAYQCCVIAGSWYQNGEWVIIRYSQKGDASCCGNLCHDV